MARGSSKSDFTTTRFVDQRSTGGPFGNVPGRVSFEDEMDEESNVPERDRRIIGWTNPINGAKVVAVNGDSVILMKPDGGAMVSHRRVVESIQRDQSAVGDLNAVLDKVSTGSALKQPGADLAFGGYRELKNGFSLLVSNYEDRGGLPTDGKYEVIVLKGKAQAGNPIPFEGKDIHDSLTAEQVLGFIKRVGKLK